MVNAYIKRIKEVNPYVNAVVEKRFIDALKEAKEIDHFLSNRTDINDEELKLRKPLLGVPVTIKESCQLKGNGFFTKMLLYLRRLLRFIVDEEGVCLYIKYK